MENSMQEHVTVQFEDEFKFHKQGVTQFITDCIAWARKLNDFFGYGISLKFFASTIHPMASFNYKGENIGRICFGGGELVVPKDIGDDWRQTKNIHHEDVWQEFFLPRISRNIDQKRKQLRELKRKVETAKNPLK